MAEVAMAMPAIVEWTEGLAGLRLDLLGRLLLAAFLGGIVGLERELSGKPAGFRTNLLICVGAALLTELSIAVAGAADPGAFADPGRIAAQIVSGIGFLGAGTIIQARGNVLGLTTAATLWVVAAIGIAVGAAAYVEAIGTTALVIVALLILGRVERAVIRRGGQHTVQVVLARDGGQIDRLEETLVAAGLDVDTIEVEWGADTVTATLQATGTETGWKKAMDGLIRWPGVQKVARS